MTIGKRQQYYITPKGASVKKALQHECQLKVDFANLDIVPLSTIEPNIQATLAIYNFTQQKQDQLKDLTVNFAKEVNRIVKDSTTSDVMHKQSRNVKRRVNDKKARAIRCSF